MLHVGCDLCKVAIRGKADGATQRGTNVLPNRGLDALRQIERSRQRLFAANQAGRQLVYRQHRRNRHALLNGLYDAIVVIDIDFVPAFDHKNLKVPATDLDGLMTEVNINLGGVIRMTSAFIDALTVNKGTIINVSSALAFVPLPSAPVYCATKSAVHAYTLIAAVPAGGNWS